MWYYENMKYKFFSFKTGRMEDYCRAENKEHAKKIFSYFYPKLNGRVEEIFMKDFSKQRNVDNKGLATNSKPDV